MKNSIYYLGLIMLMASWNLNNSEKNTAQEHFSNTKSQTRPDLKVEKLADGFKWGEGPAVDKEGNVYFTDVRQNKIMIWTTAHTLETLREDSHGANGLYFDKDGNLLTCEMKTGQITSTSPTGEYKVITASYNGVRYNEPNDLWADEKGGIYFTDPKYGKNDKDLSQDGMHVYYISPDHSTVTRVIDDFEKPNGLIGTSDGITLYATDAQAEKTYRYDIQEDGSLTNKTLFVEFGCDGMTIDKAGNVYLSTSGKQAVDIFSPSGKLLESIPVPERVANMCFGGKDRNQLYITAQTSLYRVKLDAKGFD